MKLGLGNGPGQRSRGLELPQTAAQAKTETKEIKLAEMASNQQKKQTAQ